MVATPRSFSLCLWWFHGGWGRGKDILVKLEDAFILWWDENISREFVQLWKERGRENSLTVYQVFSTRSICKYLKRIYIYIYVWYRCLKSKHVLILRYLYFNIVRRKLSLEALEFQSILLSYTFSGQLGSFNGCKWNEHCKFLSRDFLFRFFIIL